jgi:peptide/nickel transport system substrate-binding protein
MLASPALAAPGGTLRYDLPDDVDFTDPALAYFSHSWQVEYATCLKLLNYPDANGARGSTLVPEAAKGLPRVSNGGRTYDFTVSAPWTRFSNGERVGPQSFAHAIERVLDPRMQSPGAQFVADIVGAPARLAGEAQSLPGVRVQGTHLLITLTRPTPDFLARIAMPFFCAVPRDLPVDPTGVTPAAAGPYYIAARTPNRSLTLRHNPYYHGTRPHNPSTVEFVVGNSIEATRLRIEKGETDTGLFPPAASADLGRKYGVNERRFWVKPVLSLWYLAFNHDRPLFKTGGPAGNVALTRAVNFALDRHALLLQAGAYFGRRTDQVLPPGMPGYREADLYPTVKPPDLARAKKLAAGRTGDGHAVLYTYSIGFGPLWGQVVAYDLKQLGLDVSVTPLPPTVLGAKLGTRGEPFDIGVFGWSADYPDPYDFLNVLLSGDGLGEANNVNVSYFDDPVFNRRLRAASLLSGDARYATYGSLDAQLMRDAAPIAPIANSNNLVFVSKRVGCFTYSNVYSVDLAALCVS